MKKLVLASERSKFRSAHELAAEADKFLELALVLAGQDTDAVSFVWREDKDCEKIEQLLKSGWISLLS